MVLNDQQVKAHFKWYYGSARCGKKCHNTHPCQAWAHESKPCPNCTIYMYMVFDCGHNDLVPCHLSKSPPGNVCQFLYTFKSSCGHNVKVQCGKFDMEKSNDENYMLQFCREACQYEFPKDQQGCGHICSGNCVVCARGKFHIRCGVPCEKTLVCKHVCHHPCSGFCPPCTQSCEVACAHRRCKKPCGIPCNPCRRPCQWKCPHHACTKACFEVCDRPPCQKPCPIQLSCGHACVGFCGEICPPLCSICNKDELLAGLILSKDEVEDNDKFVYLPSCGHTIEIDVLTQWMEITPEEQNEIVAKVCPLCNARIFNVSRFNYVLKPNEAEVSRIKEYIHGTKVEMVGQLLQSIKVVDEKMPNNNGHVIFKEMYGFIAYIIRRVGNYPSLMNKMCLNSLRYLIDLWRAGEAAVIESRRKHTEFLAKQLRGHYKAYFNKVMESRFPIHMNEMLDFGVELRRLHAYSQLSDRYIKTANGALLADVKNFEAYEAVGKVLGGVRRFDEEEEEEFREKLAMLDDALKCTLDITEAERIEIVKAMGQTGRWFKCPNNHVYVVTECGGVTQTSKCNECDELVGGSNHHVLPTNALATEMDGAITTLYPDALQ